MADLNTTWESTKLWKTLQAKEPAKGRAVVGTLTQCMPDIEKVLALGGTAPTDFTLHDSGHAFRVAERMAQVIPVDLLPQLADYELALLILSAYLHDIGMTPEQRKVILHYSYILTGNPQELSPSDIDLLQKWLDDNGYEIVPPLPNGESNLENLRLAGELVTHYCRFRHNDWSEQWIRKNLSSYKLGTYSDWIDDLVTLCRSHHQGYQDLIKDRFNPRIIGSPSEVVHLRYLAVVLRIADVLEFDPERTPEVILRHREISPSSLIYWWKDCHISWIQEGNRILLSARPPDAHIHRAIEIMANQIDEELRMSKALADETHFEKYPGLPANLPHRWDLLPSVHRDIKAKEDAYEYIDGAFRPDTSKLLELLSGVALYGNSMVAIRELLQNSFDAIREQVAYERLIQTNPNDPTLESNLGRLHEVELFFETSAGDGWLICRDSGVGMTKAIIRDHLLVSGMARRHDVLALERRCKAAGFSLGRTGQFGIGVLSYFMIADRVIIRTRRSQQPGDDELTGWSFETDGIGSFGELRVGADIKRGSEIRLHLRAATIGKDWAAWYSLLRDYILRILAHIPCRFKLRSDLPNSETITLEPGWVRQRKELTATALKMHTSYRDIEHGLPLSHLSVSLRQQREAEEHHWKEVYKEAAESLRWKVREGDLPNGLGRFRLHLPYFQLLDGASLVFLRVRPNAGEKLIDKLGRGYAYIPFSGRGWSMMAWKGMNVLNVRDAEGRTRLSQVATFMVEINWSTVQAGTIAVNREFVNFTETALDSMRWLKQQINDMGEAFLHEYQDSAYSSVNYRLLEYQPKTKHASKWLLAGGDNQSITAKWGSIKFPATTSLVFIYSNRIEKLFWKKQPISVLRCLGGPLEDDHYKGLAWIASTVPPDRIVLGTHSYAPVAIPLWSRLPTFVKRQSVVGLTSTFPPRWKNISSVYFRSYSNIEEPASVWNKDHLIVRVTDSVSWDWCRETFQGSLDPLPYKQALLSDRSRSAAWLINCFQTNARELWDGLHDRDASFLMSLWKLLFGVASRLASKDYLPVCRWIEDVPRSRMDVLTPQGWQVCSGNRPGVDNSKQLATYLPDPGPGWTAIGEKRRDFQNLRHMIRTTTTKKRTKALRRQ